MVMIGVDPHKASHTAVAISAAEEPLGQLQVRASAGQAQRLLAWAAAWPERAWAIEGADGVGHLLAQQLLAAGEQVLDIQPKLSARVRLLATGDTNKNDPNDARSVAVAALRSVSRRVAAADDYAAVLKVWSKRRRNLGRTRTQVVCRLHAVLCELVPGGVSKKIIAGQAAAILGSITPADAVAAARCELAAEFVADLRRIDTQMREARAKAGGCGEGLRHEPHRGLRCRPGDCRRRHRRRARGVPLPGPGSFRRLQRHRADRGVLGPAQGLPAVPARQPAAQSRHPYGRRHPDPQPPQPGPRLLRQEAGRGQNPQRGPALAEAPRQRRHLRPPAS
jgi:transposase